MSTAQRVAEEAQLLAEERWIVSALKKIRTQRNCLQIERLQLESMLSQSRCEASNKESIHQPEPEVASVQPSPILNENAMDLVVKWNEMKLPDTHVKRLDDDVCNFEELNLSVSTSVFDSANNLHLEEEDEEEAEEESDSEMVIDMNLMMNSDQGLGNP